MNNVLEKLFKKQGIESTDELAPEEKETFDRWKAILSDGDMTLEKLSAFLTAQIGIIERLWRDHKVAQDKKAELIPYHTVYTVIKEAISAPQAEKESLERYLTQLVNS